MPSTFIFGCLELKKRSCETPIPKSIVYSDVLSVKLGPRYKSFFPSKNAESYVLKLADGLSHWQVLKLSKPLNYWKLCKKEIESCLSKKSFKKNMKIIG